MKLKTGVLGATGLVGREIINVLYNRHFPIESLRLYASERSAGKTLETPFGRIEIENADNAGYSVLELAFFAIGHDWPKANAGKATDAGCTVIDNSSTFRYDADVPLVVPEINPEAIGDAKLIANPNCTTAIAAIPLWHIYKHFGLREVRISTYQAASGAGREAMEELEEETRNALDGREAGHNVFQYPLPFNLIPQIDAFQPNEYTREEMNVVWETRKILGDDPISIECICVRVPIMRAHSESISVKTREPVDLERLTEILGHAEGVELRDKPEQNIYPMPLTAT